MLNVSTATNGDDIGKKSRLQSIKDHFSNTKMIEEESSDEIAMDDVGASIFLIIVNGLAGLYFIAHQVESTGFFTAEFRIFEMVLLCGILIYWITTSTLILIGQKHPSRDLDSFGGLFFATFAILWLIFVFPFDFTHFADVWQPEFLKFLVQWISDGIALVILIILFILHLIAAVYSLIQRIHVRQAMRKRGEKK